MRVAEVRAVRAGVLDLAFRRWERPRLRPGTRMRTAVGLVEVVSVDLVEPEAITDDDALRAGAASREELMSRLSAHPDRPVFRVVLRYAGPDPRGRAACGRGALGRGPRRALPPARRVRPACAGRRVDPHDTRRHRPPSGQARA
jgi:hypothetical protein